MPERAIPILRNSLPALTLLACLGGARAQPTPVPTTGDLKCIEESAVVPTDTLASGGVDEDGYFPLFDGTFTGWFQSCKTSHSNGSTDGAIFRIGKADDKPVIYTTQRGTSTGGIMMTKKKFTNYEITFQTWPDYGNDAGLFNRTPITGVCFQTVLDYIGSASVGGTWSEGGFQPQRDFRPFTFTDNEKKIAIPGGTGELADWTLITRKLKASTEPNLPCAATGCTQDDWLALWDFDGWNEIKIQFYGGWKSGTGNIHMKSWFKKPSASTWVPIIQDTILDKVIPAGYIGIQVHGGGRFGGTKGTWYRGIRWKPLDDKGVAIPQKRRIDAIQPAAAPRAILTASSGFLSGTIDRDFTLAIRDSRGRLLERFAGKAGPVRHAFASDARGILLVQVSGSQGRSETHRLIRPRE